MTLEVSRERVERCVRSLIGAKVEHVNGCHYRHMKSGVYPMDFHRRILEWQAAHPNITWIGWGIVWAIVMLIMLWPIPVE